MESRVTLRVGETYLIIPTANPPEASITTGTFSTNASAIASVSSDGLVTARRAGTATITVRIDGKSATLRVTVVR